MINKPLRKLTWFATGGSPHFPALHGLADEKPEAAEYASGCPICYIVPWKAPGFQLRWLRWNRALARATELSLRFSVQLCSLAVIIH